MAKVLVLGLDGATWDVIQPLVSAGRLPTLAAMVRHGAWGTLRSTVPPISPTAWTTFYTGKNPGKHGIYDFQERDPVTYASQPIRSTSHREKSLWQLLSEAGKTSIVIDVPFTYPPQALQGVLITGYGTPRTPTTVCTYPADLAQQVPASVQSEVRVGLPQHRFDRSQALLDAWRAVLAGRRHLLRHLLTERRWDFACVVLTITDNLAHIFWTYVDPRHPNFQRPEAAHWRQAFFHAYEQCDALLAEMMAWAGTDATTLVMSDHGFGSVYPRQYLYQHLVAGGFLAYQRSPWLQTSQTPLINMAMRAYTRMPRLREWIKNLRPQRQYMIKRLLCRGGLMPGKTAPDYQRSRILPSDFGLHLWVNEQQHSPHGIVAATDREALLHELQRYLPTLTEPMTQEPVIAAVHRGSDLYHGPVAALGPDLILELTNFYRPTLPPPAANPHLEGGHTGHGILLAQGPNIQAGQLPLASLEDLAPTILHLCGQVIPPDVDGQVLSAMFTAAFRDAHPVRPGQVPARFETTPGDPKGTYSQADRAEIEEQLRQLGYL